MAMNKTEQAHMAHLEEQARLLTHTSNPCVHYPCPKIGDGWAFRICGFGMDGWRVEKGEIRNDCWFENGKGIGAQLRDPSERFYRSESDAWQAIYCRMRDFAAQRLSNVWQEYQKATDLALA